MKSILTLCLFFINLSLAAQSCDCASQLSEVINYFEQNSPAFQKLKTNTGELNRYTKEVQRIRSEAGQEKDRDRCIFYLDRYVTLLKDHHSGIGFNLQRMDLSTEEKIRAFRSSANYRKFPKLDIDTASLIPLLQAKKTSDIEGIYSDGRTLFFGVMKKKGSRDRYQGVVLRKNRLLDPGQVLLELTRKKNNTYDIVYNVGLLGFNFQRIFKNIPVEKGQMPVFGFSKITGPAIRADYYEFRKLDDSTNYLRLGSFDGRRTKELDSFYLAISNELKTKPYLVIDLRNNGGGSESSYFNLLPYAYTGPLKIDSAEIWVTPENIKRYEEAGAEQHQELIRRMKSARPYSFIPFTEDAIYSWSLDSATVLPRKIALLFNKGTASAAEGMILYLMQSSKVITIGENSGGYIGYGNLMTAQTSCGQYTIQYTTTKYAEKSKYEFTGIPPQYRPEKKQDWVNFARGLLVKP